MGWHMSSSKLYPPVEIWTQSVLVPWAHMNLHVKPHHDRFGRFCTARVYAKHTDMHSDRQTDRHATAVAIGHIYTLQR